MGDRYWFYVNGVQSLFAYPTVVAVTEAIVDALDFANQDFDECEIYVYDTNPHCAHAWSKVVREDNAIVLTFSMTPDGLEKPE